MILVGDIGGTNARIALASIEGTRVTIERTKTYPSASYTGLTKVLEAFVAETEPGAIEYAAFGIAGVINGDTCEATNLPWSINARDIEQRLGIPSAGLLNDLESAAWGIGALEPDKRLVINEGDPDRVGNRAVVSAGTGLGQAGLYWDGTRHHPYATEGGHTDFAPRNELEFELLEYLIKKYGRVSYERVLSGPGVVNIYDFYCVTGRYSENPEVRDAIGGCPKEEVGRTITNAALEGRCERCDRVLDLFLTLYGSEVGNVVLKFFATGGVWLGGGIIAAVGPRVPHFNQFLGALTSKGRLSPLIEQTPVTAILDDAIALRGAALYAQHRFG